MVGGSSLLNLPRAFYSQSHVCLLLTAIPTALLYGQVAKCDRVAVAFTGQKLSLRESNDVFLVRDVDAAV